MEDIGNKFTLEEIYLIRTCNLTVPDKKRIRDELTDYIELDGMKELIRGVINKLEYTSEEELQKLWEYPLD